MVPPSSARAIADCGPNNRLAVLRPAINTSLRAIETMLRNASVDCIMARGRREIYVRVEDLVDKARPLLGQTIFLTDGLATEVRSIADGTERHDRARRVIADVQRPGRAQEILAELEGLGHLDAHQVEAVAAIAHPDVLGLCLFDEQGLGKTVTALFAYHRMRQTGSVSRMLVFAPKSMVYEWLHDAQRFLGDTYRCQAIVGNESEKRAACDADADIYVTNYETAVRLARRLQQMLVRDRGQTFLVVDESFFVKNADALRTQAIRQLRRLVARCLVLCGTPAPNSPYDLVEQFNIADGGRTFHGISAPEDRDSARTLISETIESRGVYLRRLKHRVLDLPGKTFNRVLTPMQPQQESIYSRILTNLISSLEQASDIQFRKNLVSFMAQRSALLQTCSNPAAVADGYSETPAKLLALDSILEELIKRQREKVVVWSFYRHSLSAIFARYRTYNPVRLDGSVTDPALRREAVRRFQEDDETMLFIGNPAAAGAGITLHRARYAVYESLSNQAAHYLQSLDRIHRRGQRRAVEYVVLLCTGTLEETEYARLLRKQASARELLGDDVDETPTREAMLREALDAARAIGLSDDRLASSMKNKR